MCSLWYWPLGGKKKGGMRITYNNIQINKSVSSVKNHQGKKDLMIELMTV